jgi:predicted Zn-dependent protease
LFTQALSLGRLGKHAEAEEKLTEPLAKWPDDPAAMMNLAHAQSHQGKRYDAIQSWETVLRDGVANCPSDHRLWYNLANDLDYSHRGPEARQAYEKFLNLAASCSTETKQIDHASRRLRELRR